MRSPGRCKPSRKAGLRVRIASPEPDTYGQYARASLLADYIELLALKGSEVKRSDVAEFLADNDWDLELILGTVDGNAVTQRSHSLSEMRDDAGAAASIVFDQLAERHDVLGALYPFDISEYGVSRTAGVTLEESAYVALLTLTVAHAFDVQPTADLAPRFERAVTRVLECRGLRSVCLAEIRRSGQSFDGALRGACDAVGLRANPGGAPTLAYAHDEKVDVLCHFAWEYEVLRPGAWAFIGQATVGRSDSWFGKIREPSPSAWVRRIGSTVCPLPFLAVPHHVERPMMEKLTVDGNAVVLDRLRLVRFKAEVDGEERATIRAVTEEDMEPLIG